MVRQGDRKQVSVRIPIRQKAELEREAAERGVSRSEYIRSILDDRHRADDLANRIDIKTERIDELEAQLSRRSQVEQKVDTLAKQQEKESEAPFFVKWYKWWRSR
jgi:hypothetical protein